MVEIMLTHEQASLLSGASGSIVLVDPAGNTVGEVAQVVTAAIDPEDVQAAMRMKRSRHELTHEMMMEMADGCIPPADLFDVE